jgi:diguanylate cyclase (GGDEF)-like protein
MGHLSDHVPISIFAFGLDLRISECNASLATSLGCSREDLIGLDLRHKGRGDLIALTRALQGDEVSFEGNVTWPQLGGEVAVSEIISPLHDAEGRVVGGTVVVLKSTDTVDLDADSAPSPGREALTGLPDRDLLMDRLRMAVNLAERGGTLSVVALDIGRTKEVAATIGLEAGEKLRLLVAEHLTPFIRASDTLGCLGEDLFAIVVPSMGTVAQVVAMMGRLLSVFDGHLELGGQQILLTPGIGVATYPGDGADAETLLAHAIGVAFRAGREDPHIPRLFNESRQMAARERLALEVDLRSAVEHEEFVLWYQPEVAARGCRIVGFEALLRWQHPTRGLVFPDAFVPVAEQTRLIVPLGAWVLRTACAQLAAWRQAGLPPVRMAVNLAAPQFEKGDLPALVSEAINSSGIAPDDLELEITERVAFADEAATTSVLQALKDLGTRITLDDFGTGYSSAALLTTFPFDTLKIDRSFVAKLEEESKELLVTEAFIELAHRMGLSVVAEGVETQEQLDRLRRLGADEIQGYFFSKPVPAGEAAAMLGERRFELAGDDLA